MRISFPKRGTFPKRSKAPHTRDNSFPFFFGLGTPAREFADTRHNVGFMLLDRLAARERAAWRAEKSWQSAVAKAGFVMLAKPLTYMNLSGQAVRPLASFYKIEPQQMLIVLDDMALPLGKLRFRADGSSGGQKGMKSIIEHFGTPAIPRLRIGPPRDGTTTHAHHYTGSNALSA